MKALNDDIVISLCDEHVLSLKPTLHVDLDSFDSIEVKLNGSTFKLDKNKLLKLIEESKDYVEHFD